MGSENEYIRERKSPNTEGGGGGNIRESRGVRTRNIERRK